MKLEEAMNTPNDDILFAKATALYEGYRIDIQQNKDKDGKRGGIYSVSLERPGSIALPVAFYARSIEDIDLNLVDKYHIPFDRLEWRSSGRGD